MTNEEILEMLSKVDDYGNNIDFPDDVVSDMTIKGLLGKWMSLIISHVTYDVDKYYARKMNIDAGSMSCIRNFFRDTNNMIRYLTPVLEDLTNERLYGIEDITIAVYGIGSDEVLVLREFLSRMHSIDEWDEDYMWNDYRGHERLKSAVDRLFYIPKKNE